MKKTIILSLPILLALIALPLSGCTKLTPTPKEEKQEYQTITSEKAKEMIDNDPDIIILDVRTEEEYNSGHIENALLIPDSDIESQAPTALTDKEATILVYCRSGRRSALASKKLSDLGYTNIYDFGGILDWNYDIISNK